MENLSLPPFYVGQKVVATVDSKYGYFKKGVTYTAMGFKKCCKWLINIGEFMDDRSRQQCRCCHEFVANENEKAYHDASLFLPIQEQDFKQTTYSKIMEEVTCCDN